jgi:hypothetical protein
MTTTTMNPIIDVPVRKTITVKASPERAFRVFAEEFDSWWPRSHHIGKAPMKKTMIQVEVASRRGSLRRGTCIAPFMAVSHGWRGSTSCRTPRACRIGTG